MALFAGDGGPYRGSMDELGESLDRWTTAGLIDAVAAERIRDFESARRLSASVPPASNRPGAMEALLYLGFVILGAGAWALIAQGWSELEPWARVASLAIPMVLLLLAGAAMRLSGEPQLRRGSQAAWFVAVPLFAGLLGVLFDEYGPGVDDNGNVLMVLSAATLTLACALWLFNPSHAQVAAMAGATAFLAETMGAFPDDYSTRFAGVALLVAGAAGVVLAEAGWLTPRRSARLLYALILVAGPYQAGFDGPIAFEFLAGALATGVIALGVVREDFALVMAGVAVSFIVLITFIFEHFEDHLGAPLALMVSGGAVIAGVMLLAALRGRLSRAMP